MSPMTVYKKKLERVKKALYKNQGQIDAVIAIRKFIDQKYSDDLNLDELSRAQYISKYHLLRLFKKYYGQTPRQYLIDKRVDASKKYLNGGRSVTETCFAVGFESLGSLQYAF